MKKSIVSFFILCGVLSASCSSNGDNTVTCSETLLMWQDDAAVNSNSRDWQSAINYCESSTLAGYSDWRLPNIKELKSIADRIAPPSTSSTLRNGFSYGGTNDFWSSTTYLPTTAAAWHVAFSDGDEHWNNKFISYHVRCVR